VWVHIEGIKTWRCWSPITGGDSNNNKNLSYRWQTARSV